MSDLVPRTLRTQTLIIVEHVALRDDAYRAMAMLRAARARYRTVHRAGRDLDPIQARQAVDEMHFCSRAIQVFAHMAIEAALNEYGLLRFGAEPFERVAARAGPARKVKILLGAALDATISDNDEIVQVVGRSAHRRNALVHPRAEIYVRDESGTFDTVSGGPIAPVDLEAARLAIADMERFLELLPFYDPEATLLCRARAKTSRPHRRTRRTSSPPARRPRASDRRQEQ